MIEQISNTELSAEIHRYQKKLDANKATIIEHQNNKFIKERRKDKGEYILQRAEIYEKLIELRDKSILINKPIDEISIDITSIDEISAKVTDDLVSFGLEQHEADYTRKILPKKYKREYNITNREKSRLKIINMIESGGDLKSLSSEELEDCYKIICTDQYNVKQKGERLHTMQWRVKQIADERGLALLDEYTGSISEQIENSRSLEEKISINDINVISEKEIDESIQVNFDKLVKSLLLFHHNFAKINKKMKRYPLTDDNVRKNLNYYLIDFKTRIDATNKVLQSLGDDKGTLSPSAWNFMKGSQQYDTNGAIASMLKQTTLSGEPEKPTTKGIKKAFRNTEHWEEFEKLICSDDFPMSLRWLLWQLNAWYNCSSQYPIVRATHKKLLHDKRSDSANWRKGCETSEYLDFSVDRLKERSK